MDFITSTGQLFNSAAMSNGSPNSKALPGGLYRALGIPAPPCEKCSPDPATGLPENNDLNPVAALDSANSTLDLFLSGSKR